MIRFYEFFVLLGQPGKLRNDDILGTRRDPSSRALQQRHVKIRNLGHCLVCDRLKGLRPGRPLTRSRRKSAFRASSTSLWTIPAASPTFGRLWQLIGKIAWGAREAASGVDRACAPCHPAARAFVGSRVKDRRSGSPSVVPCATSPRGRHRRRARRWGGGLCSLRHMVCSEGDARPGPSLTWPQQKGRGAKPPRALSQVGEWQDLRSPCRPCHRPGACRLRAQPSSAARRPWPRW